MRFYSAYRAVPSLRWGHALEKALTMSPANIPELRGRTLESIPATVPMCTWNLAGYAAGHAPSGSRHGHTFGGLTDQAFCMIPLLEDGRDARWPWEQPAR